MEVLRQSMLEYVAFMDMDVCMASAAAQKDKFDLLSTKLVQALALPSLNVSPKFKATLRAIHSEILSLLARCAELKAKSAQYLRASSEKESLLQEINKAKTELNELSFEIQAEDSLMMTLAAEMKELQAKMDDCKARMAAKERNASQEVERTKSLVERY